MRDLFPEIVELGRTRAGRFATDPRDSHGQFRLVRDNVGFIVIATRGHGWDHVSASTATRCPTWEEMCWIKDLFFTPSEPAMQLHVPASEHVNNHPFCLHLWRPQGVALPMPPSLLVGVKSQGVLSRQAAIEISNTMHKPAVEAAKKRGEEP